METLASTLSRKQLLDLCNGLALMAAVTALWVFIAEIALDNRDHGAVGGAFGIIIIYSIICYVKLNNMARQQPKGSVDDAVEKSHNKKMYVIMASAAIVSIGMKLGLMTTRHDNLTVPLFALIVGLHFLPVGKILNHTFYYVAGIWICLMGVIGLGLIFQGVSAIWYNPFVGIGCALATAANAIRIIRLGGITSLEV
ncbi:hypothetical protein [Mucilaginibacter myungsuensis]|uniref:Uncharacterized protein n=1 Tax=Mucilaginibacter myungsuensis TaxID=649104 RepID=A0A929PWR3_9SPHI|nr:hypothetical protein [Mucilaginibacter myungsuensis]MBE9662361.1 hypothetical protein [Mucilaginibacter myungsuensis]MDN3599202.1 hypothetical protein [Mucilaginibacter myungsuensis]